MHICSVSVSLMLTLNVFYIRKWERKRERARTKPLQKQWIKFWPYLTFTLLWRIKWINVRNCRCYRNVHSPFINYSSASNCTTSNTLNRLIHVVPQININQWHQLRMHSIAKKYIALTFLVSKVEWLFYNETLFFSVQKVVPEMEKCQNWKELRQIGPGWSNNTLCCAGLDFLHFPAINNNQCIWRMEIRRLCILFFRHSNNNWIWWLCGR